VTATVTGQRPKFALTVMLCFLVAVVEGYDLQVLSAIGPLLRGSLHLNPEQLGLIFSSSLIGLGIGATVGGHIADRVGRKRVIVLAAFAMSLFTFLTAVAVDYPTLFLTRVLTGLAIGGAMPNAIVMVEAMTERARGSTGVVTLMMCGIPAGGIVAALASHGLAGLLGWRGVLAFGGAFSLLVAAAAQLWLTQPGSVRSPESSQGLGKVLFGEGRAPATLLLWALSVLSLAVVAALATWLPTLAVDKGLGTGAGFSTLLAYNIGGVCGVVFVGRLCDRLGPRNTLILAYLGEAVLFVLFTKGSTASTFMLFAAMVNFFVAGSHYTLYGLSPRLYPAHGAGAGVGAALAIGRVGSVLGPAAFGLLLNAGSTGGQVILGLTPVAVLCALCVAGLVIASRGRLDRGVSLQAPAPDPIRAHRS
jgi:AAHS family 3-hydroxyphenylpropionic acid transporter